MGIICFKQYFKIFKSCVPQILLVFAKWSKTIKQFVGKLPTNCLSVFGHIVGLKGASSQKVAVCGWWSIRRKCSSQLEFENQSTWTIYEICWKWTVNALEWLQWRHSGVFIVNSEQISHLVLVFSLSNLHK